MADFEPEDGYGTAVECSFDHDLDCLGSLTGTYRIGPDDYWDIMKDAIELIGTPETNELYAQENEKVFLNDESHAIPGMWFNLFQLHKVFQDCKVMKMCGRWEKAPTTGTIHFQAMCALDKKVRPSTIALKLYQYAAGVIKVHIQGAFNAKGAEEYSYSSKKEGALHGFNCRLPSYNEAKREGKRTDKSHLQADAEAKKKARCEKWERVEELLISGMTAIEVFKALECSIDLSRIIVYRDELQKQVYNPRLDSSFIARPWQQKALQHTMDKVAKCIDPEQQLDDDLRKIRFFVGSKGNEGKSVAGMMIEDACFETYQKKAIVISPTTAHFEAASAASFMSVSNGDTVAIVLNIGRTFNYTNWMRNFEPLIESWLDGRASTGKYKGAVQKNKYVVVVFCNDPPPEHERGLTSDRYDIMTCDLDENEEFIPFNQEIANLEEQRR